MKLLKRDLTLTFFLLGCCLIQSCATASSRVLWQQKEPIEIPIGETPQTATINLPNFSLGNGEIACVQFSAFMRSDHPAGWNHFLGIDVNGKEVTGQNSYNQPRLLNHSPIFHTTNLKEGSVPYFAGMAGRVALNTFFAPSVNVVEPQLLDNKKDSNTYLLDLNDLLQPAKSNQITFTNLAINKYWKGHPNSKMSMVISNLELIAIPRTELKQMQNALLEHRPILSGATISGGGSTLTAVPGGGLQLDVNGEKYFWESKFSYPGAKIGWDQWLCQKSPSGENGWSINTSRTGDTLEISSRGQFFSLQRQVKWDGQRFVITDTVTNLTANPLGFMRQDNLIGADTWTDYRQNGRKIQAVAERTNAQNPTLFLGQNKSGLGVLLESSQMRLQWGGEVDSNQAKIVFNHNGLQPHAARSFRWSIYPQRTNAKSTFTESYFHFINTIRDEWKTNFTVPGPFDYYLPPSPAEQAKDPHYHPYSLPGQTEDQYLHDEIARKGVKIFAINPWYGYYFPETSDADFRALMQARIKKIKAADPSAKCIACVETNLTRVPMSFFGDTVPVDIPWGRPGDHPPIGKAPGKYGWPATPAMEAKINNSPWKDSVVVGKDGKVLLDTWYVEKYNGKDLNFMVYPTLTNHWNQVMKQRIKFLLDDVGFDGVYIDQFAITGTESRTDTYTYNQWDGATVNIDPQTGKIAREYTDITYLSKAARTQWIDEVLKRGKLVVVNGDPVLTGMQSLPIMRFMETGNYDVSQPGAPEGNNLYKGQLSTPIGLGYQWTPKAQAGGAKLFNRSVIANLKYGMLYYYYTTRFPATGPLGGEFGPVKNMFPLTPVKLGEGFIIGKERIITCVSRSFLWPHSQKPKVLLFDESGRKILPSAKEIAFTKTKNGWNVNIHLRDWYQIAIVG
jgi:hypothetical protein